MVLHIIHFSWHACLVHCDLLIMLNSSYYFVSRFKFFSLFFFVFSFLLLLLILNFVSFFLVAFCKC